MTPQDLANLHNKGLWGFTKMEEEAIHTLKNFHWLFFGNENYQIDPESFDMTAELEIIRKEIEQMQAAYISSEEQDLKDIEYLNSLD